MTQKDKILQLKGIIRDSLSHLIDRDYYLLEVPYYTNIGDTLIWQGEMEFLKQFPYKCRGMYSLETFPWKSIPEESLILFQGGGNFGDLWSKHHDFKMNIIKHYSNNHFVFFPQTVFFQDKENLTKCAQFLSLCKNVTICARDSYSYKVLKDNFSNTILLVPDMAFYMDTDKWNIVESGDRDLFLRRTDAEFKDSKYIRSIMNKNGVDICDWPTMWPLGKTTKILHLLRDAVYFPKKLADLYAYYIYRPYLMKSGLRLLASHKTIYTTRLHTAILGILMSKDVVILDNSYGKNKNFFDTWLYDCAGVNFIDD